MSNNKLEFPIERFIYNDDECLKNDLDILELVSGQEEVIIKEDKIISNTTSSIIDETNKENEEIITTNEEIKKN